MARQKNETSVNYDALKRMIGSSSFSYSDVGAILGKGDPKKWFTQNMRRNGKMAYDDICKISALLKCNVSDIILTPVIESAEQDNVRLGTLDTKPLEDKIASLENKVDLLTGKVDKMIELLASLSSTQNVNPVKAQNDWNKKPRAERAKLILEDLVIDGDGKCLRTTFIKKLAEANIASSYAEEAIKANGYEKATTGLGNNTTTYVIDPYWGKGDK